VQVVTSGDIAHTFAAVLLGLAGSMSSGKIHKRTHQTDRAESRPRAQVAKGTPLSVRMICGWPYSRKRRAKTGLVRVWVGARRA
jgi:hypothetical protein